MSDTTPTGAKTTENTNGAQPTAGTDVYAVHGADPEVQAYAMAKYSRSALSMKQSLKEISEQKAEQFLNTFYFQYGHRSIADLAHVAFAVEKLSLLAAIALVDEQRWDGQERSTRYQNFKKSGFFTPDLSGDGRALYEETARFLFSEYEAFSAEMFRYLAGLTPKPTEMDQGQYDRTLKARAFDIARYLLPLATNTSLGQIVNARTLENQISRLLAHSHSEVRQLGELLREASRRPAYNVQQGRMEEVVAQVRAVDEQLAQRIAPELLREVRVSPTLVKYTTPNEYDRKTREELQQAAAELMRGQAIEPVQPVQLLPQDPLEIELATTLLYWQSHYSYRQLRQAVEALSGERRREIIQIAVRHRGKHDELLRPFSAGQRFRFDVLMDVGGFRDMHRHRRCNQIEQGFTHLHGYDQPAEIAQAGLDSRYHSAMERAVAAAAVIAAAPGSESEENSQYLLPLAFRKRCLFNMDFAEAVYIAELRTGEGGHFSYRAIAYGIFEEVKRAYPALAGLFRVTDIRRPVDLLKR